jgi:flagellum-specific peptidoglycan hydrolase FlgJ
MFARLSQYILLLIMFNFFTIDAKADVVKKYIEQYSTLVQSLSIEFGIPRSVITAISIVESGAGKSRTVKLLNNHFGVVGKNNLQKAKGIKTKYKHYSSAEESFREFCKMISRKKYYTKLKGNMNYSTWVNAMAKAGYSTKPEVWKKEITHAIKKYKLHLLDTPATE